MILTSHAIAGTIVASLVPNHPVLGFGLGLVSHYLLDMIPHWEAPMHTDALTNKEDLGLASFKNKILWLDFFIKGSDLFIGISLSALVLYFMSCFNLQVLIIGASAGVLPDLLQFFYLLWKKFPLNWIQRFHEIFHNNHFEFRKIEGILTQVITVFFLIILAFFIKK